MEKIPQPMRRVHFDRRKLLRAARTRQRYTRHGQVLAGPGLPDHRQSTLLVLVAVGVVADDGLGLRLGLVRARIGEGLGLGSGFGLCRACGVAHLAVVDEEGRSGGEAAARLQQRSLHRWPGSSGACHGEWSFLMRRESVAVLLQRGKGGKQAQ